MILNTFLKNSSQVFTRNKQIVMADLNCSDEIPIQISETSKKGPLSGSPVWESGLHLVKEAVLICCCSFLPPSLSLQRRKSRYSELDFEVSGTYFGSSII